ncbi:hypothetical protein [Sulfitobacter dubius]|uniref:hypothetical protein n=1 Tax=Sulfitobacter dubius TaxID=218673 RepID=UPI002942829E|nr:hypothetical protein [Sulfitobacter dubius]WOI30059.1 hypothetical protein R1T39_04970 [Sulfitobacter dubius]
MGFEVTNEMIRPDKGTASLVLHDPDTNSQIIVNVHISMVEEPTRKEFLAKSRQAVKAALSDAIKTL